MTPRTYVLYHGNCYDGFGAAYAAWIHFGDQAKYIPVTHGQPIPEIPDGSNVFILDFSYSQQDLLALAKRMIAVTVIDHHKTAEEDLRDINSCSEEIWAYFDMTQSGAMLTWKYFHNNNNNKPPELIRYIEDRDLWKFELPESREVAEGLRSWPMNFDVWESLDIAVLKEEGRAILRHTDQQVRMICSQARLKHMNGLPCITVNATCFWSEVGARLLKDHPEAQFAASYYDDKRGNRIWSLRSRPNFDVSVVAQEYGGGGHAQAAGFTDFGRADKNAS